MDYNYFYDWAMKEFGINLHGYKDAQMQRRLASIMRKSGAVTFKEYSKLIESSEQLRIEFLNHVTINVTEFMRNKDKFREFEEVLISKVVPNFKTVKIWSAACSNGSEPYTIGMIANSNNVSDRIKIVATDIDENILKAAKMGEYEERDIKSLDKSDVEKYFKRKENKYIVDPIIKQMVDFKKHDLMNDRYEQNNHVIVCRNVTIYFKNEIRDEIYRKFSNSLISGGILFIGATESVYNPSSYGLKKITASIYEKE